MKKLTINVLFYFLALFSVCAQASIEAYSENLSVDPGVHVFIANGNGIPHQGKPGWPEPQTLFTSGDEISIGFELSVQDMTEDDFDFVGSEAWRYREGNTDKLNPLNPDFSLGNAGSDYTYRTDILDWEYYFVSNDNGVGTYNTVSDYTRPDYGWDVFETEKNKGTEAFYMSGTSDVILGIGHWDAYVIIESKVFKLDGGFDVIPEPDSIILLGLGLVLLRYRFRR